MNQKGKFRNSVAMINAAICQSTGVAGSSGSNQRSLSTIYYGHRARSWSSAALKMMTTEELRGHLAEGHKALTEGVELLALETRELKSAIRRCRKYS